MKHLFFVAVAVGIFSGTTVAVKAQTNINIERFGDKAQPKVSPRFIEDIEIVQEVNSSIIIVDHVKTPLAEEKVFKPAGATSGFNGTIELCSSLQFKYAMLMNLEVESVNNFSLYTFIEEWWATRYRYGGSDRNGIDCSAFTGKMLLAVYGITAPRTARDQYNLCEKLVAENLVEGDLVFFNTRGGISHVGLYLGNNYFVHSSVGSGVTISSLTDEYYSKKFISGGRIIHPPLNVVL